MLISAGITQDTEIYNFQSCLDFISGSRGYLRSYSVVKKLSKNEIDALVYALQFHKEQSINNLIIGIRLDENYKSSDIMNLQVRDILKKYYAYMQMNGKTIENNVTTTILPKWHWIQNIQNTK